jgi:hypothetical protein
MMLVVAALAMVLVRARVLVGVLVLVLVLVALVLVLVAPAASFLQVLVQRTRLVGHQRRLRNHHRHPRCLPTFRKRSVELLAWCWAQPTSVCIDASGGDNQGVS